MEWFYDELFHINFYICIDKTTEEVEQSIFKQFGLEMKLSQTALASCIDVIMDDGRFGIFIRFPSKDVPTLVHEVTHATNMVFQRIGYEVHQGNDELQAYYNQFLFTKITAFLKPKLEVLDGGSFSC